MVTAYTTPDVPPVAATSPFFKTFNDKALFGWSPALYVIGVPARRPVSFAAFEVISPWFVKFSTIFGVVMCQFYNN